MNPALLLQRRAILALPPGNAFQKPRAFTPSSAAGGTRPVLEHG